MPFLTAHPLQCLPASAI